jgi:maltooligosyltrehalose trehalohydrolase
VEFDEDEKWLSMQRGGIVVLFTLNEEGYEAEIEDGVSLLLASDANTSLVENELKLTGPGVVILSVE